jgi:hypothetical protein
VHTDFCGNPGKLDGMKAEEIPGWARGEEFDKAVVEQEINSWPDFESVYDKHFRRKRGRWYFRGQRDSGWRIETTLERLLGRVGRPANASPYPHYPCGRESNTVGARVELILLRAFQARSSKFLPNLPRPDDTLEWLALMRHWGLPSRLLDVTTSPHVALYFALADSLHADKPTQETPSPVVWAINHIPLRAIGAEQVGAQAHTDLSERRLFNTNFLADPAKAFVAPVHPRSHNERLAAQQGTFLCVGDVESSFLQNVSKCVPVEDLRGQGVFRKLVIHPGAAVEILARLSVMNIHNAALFPDLQGYARFIEQSLLLFGKDEQQQEKHLDFESLERLGWLG